MSRARNWLFTLNNWSEEEYTHIRSWTCYKYIVVGKEVGESGTPHLQGYVEFARAYRLGGVKQLLERAHWEVRATRSTPQKAAEYCKKEGDFWEDGTLSQFRQGKRTDLLNAIELLEAGGNMRELALTHPAVAIKYHRGFDRFLQLTRTPTVRDLLVKVYVGPTGCGKTHICYEQCDGELYSPMSGNTGMWWVGYVGQKSVLFDDFDGTGHVSYKQLLRYTHKWPLWVHNFGAGVQAEYTLLLMTSNRHPSLWYPGEDYAELRRRIKVFIWSAEEEDFVEEN